MLRFFSGFRLLRRYTSARPPEIGVRSEHMRADLGLPPLDEICLPTPARF